MANKKGERIASGIWRRAEGDGYIAEVNYADPETGQRIREQKTIHRLDLAQEWRLTRKADALRGEVRRKRERPARPFGIFGDEYLENWSKVEKEQSTYMRDTNSMKHLKAFFGKKDIAVIKRRDVEQYIAQRKAAGIKPGTINRELSCLKNMLRKAVDWEYLDSNPAWGVSQQREEIEEYEFLREGEIEQLLAVCPPDTRAVVTVALYTGMRRGELFDLQWRDVDFDKGERGMITVRKTKNHDTRYIPMNEMVRATLQGLPRNITGGKDEAYVFATPTGDRRKSIRNGFEGAVRRAKLGKHIRFHDLRHTFASHLVMKGIDLRTVAKLMGHRDIRVTMRYAHLAPEHLQVAVDVLAQPITTERQSAG